jgi:hypothetical protein
MPRLHVTLDQDRGGDEEVDGYGTHEINQEDILSRIPINRFAEIWQQQKNQEGEDSVSAAIEGFPTWLMHQQPGHGNKRDAASDDE